MIQGHIGKTGPFNTGKSGLFLVLSLFSPCIMCVQYIGGISWGHRGVFSRSGGYHDECGGIPCTSTSGDVQYIGGIPWVHRGNIMSTSWDVQYIGGISWYMWGSNLIKSFQFLLKTPMYWTSPDVLMISPRCTHDIPRCTHGIPRCTHGIPPLYWISPDVLMVSPTYIMISPRCTEHPPMYSWYPPDVLMVPLRCTEHPPMYSWYPPDVLMVSPRCTEHPPMYWTSPDVLNTHYTGWFCINKARTVYLEPVWDCYWNSFFMILITSTLVQIPLILGNYRSVVEC